MKLRARIQDTRLYSTWLSMLNRCYNPKYTNYRNYGNKGIIVCDEWKNSANNFMSWALLNGYSDKLTIERIDFTKGYYPNNCTFIPLAAQAGNRGKTIRNTSGYVGVSWHKDKKFWIARVTVNNKRIEIGKYTCPKKAHLARKQYFIDNNLEEHLRIYELQHRS